MMNGLQTLPQWRSNFGNPEGALLGAMNSVYPAGKVVALFLVTWICDRFGRKITIAIGALTCVAFAIMQGLANDIETFIAARAILGFFTSFLAQPSPIIITELAYPTHRGKLTALYNTSFVSITRKSASKINLLIISLVFGRHHCRLVHLRNLQDRFQLELENPIVPPRHAASYSTAHDILLTRVPAMARRPRPTD
jgi:MFS family permease